MTYANPQTVRSFGYDDLGRTTSDSLSGPGGALREQTYAYDANDNRTSTTVGPAGVAGAGTQSYGYDRADRLVSWTDQASVTTAYGWDAAGNRISAGGAAAVFDERNRLLSDGTATYDYTARGTLSTRVEGATTYTTVFDAFDRLVADNTGGGDDLRATTAWTACRCATARGWSTPGWRRNRRSRKGSRPTRGTPTATCWPSGRARATGRPLPTRTGTWWRRSPRTARR